MKITNVYNTHPEVWVSHLQFILQTIAIMYPLYPNDTTKKKYYDTIHNLPLFFPYQPFGSNFEKILNKYPMSPYLSSRESFMKWVHFINNKINIKMNWEQENFYDGLEKYYDKYKPKEILNKELYKKRKKYIMIGIVSSLVALVFYLFGR